MPGVTPPVGGIGGAAAGAAANVGILAAALGELWSKLPIDKVTDMESALYDLQAATGKSVSEIKNFSTSISKLADTTTSYTRSSLVVTLAQLRAMPGAMSQNTSNLEALTARMIQAKANGAQYLKTLVELTNQYPEMTKNINDGTASAARAAEVLTVGGVPALQAYVKNIELVRNKNKDMANELRTFKDVFVKIQKGMSDSTVNFTQGLERAFRGIGGGSIISTLNKDNMLSAAIVGLGSAYGGKYLLNRMRGQQGTTIAAAATKEKMTGGLSTLALPMTPQEQMAAVFSARQVYPGRMGSPSMADAFVNAEVPRPGGYWSQTKGVFGRWGGTMRGIPGAVGGWAKNNGGMIGFGVGSAAILAGASAEERGDQSLNGTALGAQFGGAAAMGPLGIPVALGMVAQKGLAERDFRKQLAQEQADQKLSMEEKGARWDRLRIYKAAYGEEAYTGKGLSPNLTNMFKEAYGAQHTGNPADYAYADAALARTAERETAKHTASGAAATTQYERNISTGGFANSPEMSAHAKQAMESTEHLLNIEKERVKEKQTLLALEAPDTDFIVTQTEISERQARISQYEVTLYQQKQKYATMEATQNVQIAEAQQKAVQSRVAYMLGASSPEAEVETLKAAKITTESQLEVERKLLSVSGERERLLHKANIDALEFDKKHLEFQEKMGRHNVVIAQRQNEIDLLEIEKELQMAINKNAVGAANAVGRELPKQIEIAEQAIAKLQEGLANKDIGGGTLRALKKEAASAILAAAKSSDYQRRTLMEAMTAMSLGMPSGSYLMPGNMGGLQSYGSAWLATPGFRSTDAQAAPTRVSTQAAYKTTQAVLMELVTKLGKIMEKGTDPSTPTYTEVTNFPAAGNQLGNSR